MKELVLFGNTNFTRLIKYYLETDAKRQPAFIVVDRQYISETIFDGLPVIAFEEFLERYNTDNYEILICVGYKKMNTYRQSIYEKLKLNNLTIASYIHSSAVVSPNVNLGEGNIILENVVIQPFSSIGDSNLIWHNASIAHDCSIGNYNTLASNSSLNGFDFVANNCFIGSNAVLKDHINVLSYSLIGAGTYQNKDTVEYGVYVTGESIILNKKSIDMDI